MKKDNNEKMPSAEVLINALDNSSKVLENASTEAENAISEYLSSKPTKASVEKLASKMSIVSYAIKSSIEINKLVSTFIGYGYDETR